MGRRRLTVATNAVSHGLVVRRLRLHALIRRAFGKYCVEREIAMTADAFHDTRNQLVAYFFEAAGLATVSAFTPKFEVPSSKFLELVHGVTAVMTELTMGLEKD